MKRVISLALSILMVLTAFPCISVLASAESGGSLSFIPAEPKYVYENYDGYFSNDYNGEEFFYYHCPDFVAGDILRVTKNDGTVTDYVYDPENGYDSMFMSPPGDCMEYADFGDDQYYEHWELGSRYTYTIYCDEGSVDVPVEVRENPVKSISYTPGDPDRYVYIENVNGYYSTDNYGNEFFYYYYSYNHEEDTLTVNYKDGSSENYVYTHDDWNWFYISDGGEKIEEYDVTFYNNQYQNHWLVGKENYLTVSYFGVETKIPVTIKENPVKSISYTPGDPDRYVFFENTNGYVNEDDNGEEYFYYWYSYENEGDILTVNYKDGRTVDYVYSHDNDWNWFYISADGEKIKSNDVRFNDDQYKNHWLKGKENYFTVSYLNAEVKVPVTIKENPVKSISYTPGDPDRYVYIENINGYYSTDNDGNEFFYYYYSYNHEEDTLTVNYKDGSSENYVYTHDDDWNWFYISDGGEKIEEDDVSVYNNQYQNHWLVGKENYLTVSYFGVETKIPVTIKENPVKSISYTPGDPDRYVYIENVDGYYSTDNDGNEFFYYYYSYNHEEDTLTVNYKDGSSENYVYTHDDDWNWFFISEDGEKINSDDVSSEDTQYQNHWLKGKENYFTVSYLNAEVKVPVTIKENPVKSISYTPAYPEDFEYIENTDGYINYDENGEFFEYYVRRSEGDILTVNYKEGIKKDFVYGYNDNYDWFYTSADGEVIDGFDVDYYSRQYEEHWLPGQENYVYVSYLGAETKIPVTIKENNVASIQFIPINPVTYMENTHGYIVNYNYENEYFCYYVPSFKVGDILRITDKKGAATDYTYKYIDENDDYAFVSKSGDRISRYDVERRDNQYENHWTAGTKNEYYVYYFGKTATVNVTITENPVKSISYSFGSKKINAETDAVYSMGEQGSAHFDFWAGTYPEAGAKLTLNLKNGTKETYTYNGEDYICGKKAIRGYDVDFRYDGTMYDEKSTAITVDVEYMGAKFTTSIPIAKSTVKSLEYIPATEIVLKTYKDTYGTQNDDGTFCVNYYGSQGDKIKINYTDGASKTLVYDKEKGFCYPNGDYVSLSFSTDTQGLKIGKNTCYVEYSGKVASFAVTLKDSGFSSVKYVSANGSKSLYNNMEPDELGNGKYRYMTNIFESGDKIVLTCKDGTVKTYIYTVKDYGGFGDVYFVNEKNNGDFLYSGNIFCYVDVDTREPLKGIYNATLECMGCKTTVPIEFIDNNVYGIDFVPVNKKINTFKDAMSSRTYSADNSKTNFYTYYSSSFNKGDVLKVTYSDGKTEQFTFDGTIFKTASGKKLPGRINKEVSATSSDKRYMVSYAGVYQNYNFELVNDVKSVTFVSEKDIVVDSTKYTEKASFVTDDDDYVVSSDVFEYYEEPNIFDYGYIKVTYTDGTTEIFKNKNGIFTDGTGNASKHGCDFDGFQYQTPWKEGTGNYIYLSFMGRTVKIPVTVKKPCSHKYTATVVKPTCTKDGYTLHKCSLCGDSYKDTVVKAKGHTYKNGICSVCGDWQNVKKAPTVTVANSSKGVSVTWTKVLGADGYYIYRKKSTDKSFSKLATVKGVSSLSYTDTKASGNTKYVYTVKPYKGSTAGAYDKTGKTILFLSAPTTKAANKNGYINVSWNKISGATGYVIYKKTGSGSYKKLTTIKSGSTVSYKDKSVKSGTTYSYYVKAYNGSTYSGYKASSAIMYLTAVKISSATSGKSGITVKWGKISASKGYTVYRKTGSGSYSKLATVKGATKVSYLDKSAKKGKTYTYYVVAYNGNYKGTYANTKACKDKY